MKILKYGKPQPHVKFMCRNCECEFIAESGEYNKGEVADRVFYHCPCPECNQVVGAFAGSEVDSDDD